MEMVPNDKIPAVEVAVGASDTSNLMPAMDAVPADFKNFDNKWNRFINGWFFDGVHPALSNRLVAKDGVSKQIALNHLYACLRSFHPAHNHKVSACAYLASLWFQDVP